MWLAQHSVYSFPRKAHPTYKGWENTPNFHCDRVHQGEANFNYWHKSGHLNLPRKGFYHPPKVPPWLVWPEPVGALRALTCAPRSAASYQKARDYDIMVVLCRMPNESPSCLGKPSSRQDVTCWSGRPRVTFFCHHPGEYGGRYVHSHWVHCF